jgi:hypothetical protein
MIIIARDHDGSIAGQETFVPTRIFANGHEYRALRVVAPILHERFRQPDLRHPSHPAIAMLIAGLKEASERNYQFVYFFPAYGWLPIVRLLPRITTYPSESASFDCAGIPLSEKENFLPPDPAYHITLSNGFGSEYDDLWEEAKLNLPLNCAVVRRSGWLKWKLGNHLVFELRNNSNNLLRGYCAIRKNTGLLEDVLAPSGALLETLIIMTVNKLHTLNSHRVDLPFEKIKIMSADPVRSSLKKLHLQQESFRFAFGSVILERTVPSSIFHPSNWYMMPND